MRGFFVAFLSLSILVLSLHSAMAAVGISPGMYTVDFTPGLKKQFSFEFLGNEGGELEIYAAGDLEEYATITNDRIRGNGATTVVLSLPKSLDRPGVHALYIGARQVTEENGFGIIGNVKGVINVVVPYPGQYSLISVSATNANAGQTVNFTVTVDNLGSEAVPAAAIIDIYNNNAYITSIDLGEFQLASPERKMFTEYLDTDQYAAGNYLAVAQLSYGDGNIAESNTSFRLGELKLNIVNYTKTFERDKINRFEVQVESTWNDPISNVYANVSLSGYPMAFVTPTAHVGPFGTTVLTGFFDTTGIQGDTFEALVRVHYGDRSTDELVTLSFKKEIDYLIIGLIAGIIVVGLLVGFVTFALRRVEKSKRRK